jgi:hypothetical protein
MLPRLWIVLLALLLLAAPAGSMLAGTADAPSEIGCCEDEDDAATRVELPRAEGPPRRPACAARTDGAVPPAPVLAGVFRPPRPALARA